MEFKFTAVVFFCLLIGMFLGMFVVEIIEGVPTSQSLVEWDNVNNCTPSVNHSADIFNVAECIMQNTKGFFKYNLSNLKRDLTIEELKEQGGVCKHWAKYYCDIGKELGYQTQIIKFNYNTTEIIKKSHAFCLWSSNHGYVLLDQKKGFAFKFNVNNTVP